MTHPDPPLVVTRTLDLDAPPAEVWDAVTHPDWLGGEVQLDPSPGGIGTARLPDGDRSLLVTRVEEGRELAWLWWRDDECSSVSLVLEPVAGGTRLTVVERGTATSARARALATA